MRGLGWVAILALAGGSAVSADDWPQWRGPNRDGRSAETGLLEAWPEGGPPLAWQVEGLGAGYSSVAVVGGRVYTMGDPGDGQLVLALAPGGERLWATRIGEPAAEEYFGPLSAPTVDGDRVYVVGANGEVVALETASGEVVWRRSLPDDFGSELMQAMGNTDWNYAESPLVDGDRVIVTPGMTDGALVALDKETGEELWRTAIPRLGSQGAYGAAYASAVVSHGAGVKQYVQFIGRGIIGVEAAGGRFLWGYNRVANDIANIPTPLVDGDRVFVSSGYGTGSALIRLVPGEPADPEEGEDPQTGPFVDADEVYFLAADVVQNHHGGMILHDGHVYTGTGHNRGFPIAVRLEDGAVAWGPERNEGQGSAAVAYADGRLYFRYQDGRMILVEATPEAYRERGTFLIPDVERPSWTHPVIADGLLYLREQDRLYVHDVRAVVE
jgi:outer membrane protein assembly factor BamB